LEYLKGGDKPIWVMNISQFSDGCISETIYRDGYIIEHRDVAFGNCTQVQPSYSLHILSPLYMYLYE